MSRPTMETDNEESNDVSTPLPVTDTDIATPVLASSKKVAIIFHQKNKCPKAMQILKFCYLAYLPTDLCLWLFMVHILVVL